ncbi:MAG TPA: hypothetical protein VKV33_05110 [Streptosporangiaceae bacterium]|nr:hypothetical protein [Streptosporangiaceae bacterium]
MTPDVQPPPPPELSVQAEALRAAFPRYKFVVIEGGSSIEVTRRDDTAKVPGWLLLSSDARKIWNELSRAT